MSTTTIYRLGRDPSEIGETRNAWRGAMYVWNDIARRYFGLESFPISDQIAQRKVWNAYDHAELPSHETIVLLTTMDFAVVRGADIPAVTTAFEQYGMEHPNSSFREQADILRFADLQPEDLVGWQQTSVSDFWGSGWDPEKDDITWYDPSEGKHFDVCRDAAKLKENPGAEAPG